MRILSICWAAMLVGGVLAQAPRTPVDISKLGPQVGQRVPDFNLKDQTGKVWTLQSIMGPKGAMLVFFRSADWWPYCKTQLVELQGRVTELRDKGLGLAAISYDPPETLADFSRRRGISFPLLSDAGSATIKAFGLLNPLPQEALGPGGSDPAVKSDVQKYVSVVNPRAEMVGMAFPGTLILDRQGRVVSRFFEEFYVERNTLSSVMLKLGNGAAPVAGAKISTAHLDVTTFPSDPAVAPGNHFTLALDIVPHRGIHVYAPGASGYRIVTVGIEAQPIIRLLPMTYPPSEIYFFKPLNERVPVYQKPFTLLQEVVLEGTQQVQAALRGKETVTLAGTLDYQACDDKVCFNPASVPLSWTLALRRLDTERPQK